MNRTLFVYDETGTNVTHLFETADADFNSMGGVVSSVGFRYNVLCVYLCKGWRECLRPNARPSEPQIVTSVAEASHD